MTIAQLNSNDMPTPEDHHAQGEKILATALEMAGKGFPVFPVHGLRWHRSVVPVGAATAVPGGDVEQENGELEVAQRIELRCTCGVVSCPNIGKHPVGGLVPHGFKDASTDQLQIRGWFAVPSLEQIRERGWVPWNLALATGNGLVVIDAEARQDRPGYPTGLEVLDEWERWANGSSLPGRVGAAENVIFITETGEITFVSSGDLQRDSATNELKYVGNSSGTLRVRTGSGGVHIYVSVSPGMRIKSSNRVLPAVDVKADGGYVLVPPSRHASGGTYQIIEGSWTSIGRAEESLVSWLLSAKGGRYVTRNAREVSGDVPQGYDFKTIMASDGCPAGFRDYFVNDYCFRLRQAGTTRDIAAAELRKAWARMEHPVGEEYTWQTCLYKLNRVWKDVKPADVSDLPSWRPGQESTGPIGPTVAAVAAETVEAVTGAETAANPVSRPQSAWQLLNRPELTMLLTDTGNGMRFAQRMREQVRYSPDIDKWFVWDGVRWAPDNLGQAMLLTKEIIKDLYAEAQNPALSEVQQTNLQRWAEQSQAAPRRQAMLALARYEPGLSVESKDLDANINQLVVKNGTLDLRSGKLLESSPDDMNTMCANVSFDPEATCPKWEQHIEFVTGGDKEKAWYLQRVIGYTLTGSTKEQKLFFLHGDGKNGKNTFVEAVAALLGEYAQAADTNFLNGTDEHSTQIAGLRGKRLVYVDEAEKGKPIKERKLKMLTGSKTLTARYMRKDFFEFTPRFKIIIMGNDRPPLGNDNGIWRRMKLIPFSQTLPEDKIQMDYDTQLIEELPGILNWALEGLKSWYQFEGLGEEAKAVTRATQTYREDEDQDAEFFAERVIKCSEEDGGIMVFNEVYMEYRNWCMLTGTALADMLSKKAFAQDLERRGFVRPPSARRLPKYATPQRVWLGGRLRTSEDAYVE